jgi:hypothetical protein
MIHGPAGWVGLYFVLDLVKSAKEIFEYTRQLQFLFSQAKEESCVIGNQTHETVGGILDRGGGAAPDRL